MAEPTAFVHLHNHSDYSLLDGASKVDQLVDTAVSMGMPAMAITDHGNLFCAIQFYTKVKTVTSRWPSGIKDGAEFVIPTMK